MNDKDIHTVDLLRSYHFVTHDQTENILELALENVSLEGTISEGITLKTLI